MADSCFLHRGTYRSRVLYLVLVVGCRQMVYNTLDEGLVMEQAENCLDKWTRLTLFVGGQTIKILDFSKTHDGIGREML